MAGTLVGSWDTGMTKYTSGPFSCGTHSPLTARLVHRISSSVKLTLGILSHWCAVIAKHLGLESLN